MQTLSHGAIRAATPGKRGPPLPMPSPTLAAAERLEAALERLLAAIEAREAAREAPTRDMVPRAEVEALSARLDDALARLRLAMAEQTPGGAEP